MRRLASVAGALLVLNGIAGVGQTAPADTPAFYGAKRKRDPFIPLVRDGRVVSAPAESSGPSASSSLVLVGILWDPAGHSVALVNDLEVRVGDVIEEARVVEIRPDAVVIEREGRQQTLYMSFTEGGNRE